MRPRIDPENCPDPSWHQVFHYCPVCTWTEPKPQLRRFELYRVNHDAVIESHGTDENSVSGDEITLEGVAFSDGKVAVRWLTPNRSTVVWDSIEAFMAVHVNNHPDYETKIVWLDKEG